MELEHPVRKVRINAHQWQGGDIMRKEGKSIMKDDHPQLVSSWREHEQKALASSATGRSAQTSIAEILPGPLRM